MADGLAAILITALRQQHRQPKRHNPELAESHNEMAGDEAWRVHPEYMHWMPSVDTVTEWPQRPSQSAQISSPDS